MEDGSGYTYRRLSREPLDRAVRFAAIAEIAIGAELVRRFGVDCDLPHMACDATADPLAQAVAGPI